MSAIRMIELTDGKRPRDRFTLTCGLFHPETPENRHPFLLRAFVMDDETTDDRASLRKARQFIVTFIRSALDQRDWYDSRKHAYFVVMDRSIRPLYAESVLEAIRAMANTNLRDVLIEVDTKRRDKLVEIADDVQEMFGGPEDARHAAPPSPNQPLVQEIHNHRLQIAGGWPNAEQVSRHLGSQAGNGSQLATRLRKEGKILGVLLPSPRRQFRYPPWQFTDGHPIPQMREILGHLRERLDVTPGNSTGWHELSWFLSPHALLDGRTPAEVIATEPGKVIRALRDDLAGDTP